MVASNTFGGYPLYDPREVRFNRAHFRYPDVPELMLANSLYVSGGQWPARGFILMRRGDYNKLNTYTNYDLVIQDFGKKTVPDAALTFKSLSIVQARCVSRGVAADVNAIYLIELTDQRGLVWNKWFKFPTTSQYNIRAPAYPETFYSGSLNGGSTWSWSGMIGDLWGQMTGLGAYPGIPTTPVGTPEGWSFPGVPAWEALTSILDYLGLVVTVDLTKAAPYGIAVFGGTDTGNSTRFTTYSSVLEDDWEWIDTGSGRVPLTAQVNFHRRNQYYGTEETIRNDAFQWQTTPLYSLNVTGPFPSASGKTILWADFTVRYDVDGNPLAADTATASTVATDVANNYFNRISRSTNGFMKRQYVGALPFTTGGLVDGVCWKNDFREGRKGWVTEVIRGPNPPFREVDNGQRQ